MSSKLYGVVSDVKHSYVSGMLKYFLFIIGKLCCIERKRDREIKTKKSRERERKRKKERQRENYSAYILKFKIRLCWLHEGNEFSINGMGLITKLSL